MVGAGRAGTGRPLRLLAAGGAVRPGSPPGRGCAGVPKPLCGSVPVAAGTASADGLGGLAQGEGRLPGGVCGRGLEKCQPAQAAGLQSWSLACGKKAAWSLLFIMCC